MDWSQLLSLFQNWGLPQWLIAGMMAFLAGTSPQVKGLAAKVWSKLPTIKSEPPAPDDTKRNYLDLLSEAEAMRERIVNKINALEIELAEIDKMLGVKRD